MALGALAQDTRLTVFRRLVQAGPTGLSVGAISRTVRTSPATLSFHLKELCRAGLIVQRRAGRFIYYAANCDRMDALIAFLTRNCCGGKSEQCFPLSTPRRKPSR